MTQNFVENEKPFNPAERNLDLYFFGIPAEKIENPKLLDAIMRDAVALSGANIVASTGVYVFGEGPGASSAYILSESEAAWHTTPEATPNFMSFKISTCGYTNPLNCLRKTLDKLNPLAGKVCYYFEGLDIDEAPTFPQTLGEVFEEHGGQFDTNKYRFEARTVAPYDHRIIFYQPKLLTDRAAKALSNEWPVKWPLTYNSSKKGVYSISKGGKTRKLIMPTK